MKLGLQLTLNYPYVDGLCTYQYTPYVLGLYCYIQLTFQCNITEGRIRNVMQLPLLLALQLMLQTADVAVDLAAILLKTVTVSLLLPVHTPEKHS